MQLQGQHKLGSCRQHAWGSATTRSTAPAALSQLCTRTSLYLPCLRHTGLVRNQQDPRHTVPQLPWGQCQQGGARHHTSCAAVVPERDTALHGASPGSSCSASGRPHHSRDVGPVAAASPVVSPAAGLPSVKVSDPPYELPSYVEEGEQEEVVVPQQSAPHAASDGGQSLRSNTSSPLQSRTTAHVTAPASPSSVSGSAASSSSAGDVSSAVAPAQPVSTEGEAGEEGLGWWRKRWSIVALCFVAFMLCNMDRVNMAVAILPMKQQYGWDAATQGLIQSSFFVGYLMTQILGGVWATRFGGKAVLGAGVVGALLLYPATLLWWSAATALTPLAAEAGLPVLLAVRALMGLGEGVAMPAMNCMLSRWVPTSERSRSLSLVYSGMFIGSITGLALAPKMILSLGWPSVFVGFGALGLVWFLAWQSQASSTPESCPNITPQERSHILKNTYIGQQAAAAAAAMDLHGGHSHSAAPVAEKGSNGKVATSSSPAAAEDIPWEMLLSRKEVWAIILSHFAHNWGTFILLTWMPSYYSQVLGLDLTKSAVLSVLPWVTMAVAANVGGWLADTAISRGASVTTVRKVMQTIGFLGPAFFLSQLSNVNGVTGAVLCMMGAQGCDAFSQSGLYSNHQDIAPRYAGVLLGLSNTAGVLAGVLGSLATGWILTHGSWDQVWQVAIALYLVGTLIWNTMSTGERIID